MGRRKKPTELAIIYTDGSCLGNPGEGGWSVVIFKNNKPIKISGYEPDTTNQRMELTAVIESMKYFTDPHKIVICTDSAYICNTYNNKWYNKWILNNWRNAEGKEISNIDLWKQFIELVGKHNVAIVKVKGHSTDVLNNECDKMAKDIIAFNAFMQQTVASHDDDEYAMYKEINNPTN